MALPKLSDDELATLQLWGWQVSEDQIVGKYQTNHGDWDGVIEWTGSWQFYILDCPRKVLIGNQGSCFRNRPSRKSRSVHWVHFHNGTPCPTAGIVGINQAIHYAFVESPDSMRGQ